MKRKLRLKHRSIAKHKKRRIKLGDVASSDVRAEFQDRAAEKLIQSNPRYHVIVASLREGVPVTKIARWFAEQRWIDVSERSFVNALYIFRKRNAHMLTSKDSLDALMDGNRPDVDTMVELNRLLRVQKERISIDVATEKSLGKLFNTTHKEFQVAAELIDLMLKAGDRSSGRNGADGAGFSEDLPMDVREKLRNIRLDEEKRQKIYALTQDFAKKMNNAQKENSSPSS